MRIDLTRDPELLAAEVRRLRGAIAALADQDATLAVYDGTVIVTMDATLTVEEREAVERAARLCDTLPLPSTVNDAAVLVALLERMA